MDYVAQNIRYLRKSKGLTQEELAVNLGVNRAMIGSYEENRAIPKLNVLQDFAHYFSISIDDLININLQELSNSGNAGLDLKTITGENLRVVSTIVDKDNKELIATVPVQASAGYTKGYADLEYMEELPHFSLPLLELSKERTYRVFQIKGDSMLPVRSGSYIICEYVLNWEDILNGKTYILITKDDGIVYKRVYNKIDESGELLLKSDNQEYDPYALKLDTIFEVWKALGFISFDLPEPDELSINTLHQMIIDLKNEVNILKK